MIRRVSVVGCGTMGSGIVEVCARAGCHVVAYERDKAALESGSDLIEGSLKRAIQRQKISAEGADAVRGNIVYTTDLSLLADRELVIEAIIEDEAIKRSLFAQLDDLLANESAILASNTSSIPIAKLATATRRPESVVGMHFFNPAPVLGLVEVIPSMLTAVEVADRARAFVSEQLGKTAITAPDRAGFVVNSLLVPYLMSAIRMYESGFASAEDIDAGMVLGCAHPMGPLRLADLVGLDTLKQTADALYNEFKDPLYFAPPTLLRMVDAGRLGKKSGRGFYTYESAAAA